MKSSTPTFWRRNLRAFAAGIISYLMLAGPVAPLAAPARADSPRPANEAAAGADSAGEAPRALPAPAPLALAPSITATKTDFITDSDADGKAEPGETITYTVTVTNNGPDDATNVEFSDTVDASTTLVPGSITTQPNAGADSYDVVGNVQIQPEASEGLLANDCDPSEDGSPCTNSGLTVTAMAGDSSAPFSGTSTQGGQVTAVDASGAFIYNPPPGFSGTDSFTYTVTDGESKTDTATVTLNVGAIAIWFIDDNAPAGGDGRMSHPFNCYTGVSVPVVGPTCFSDSAADDPGDAIFLYSGNYTGGNQLLNNQKLVGQGAGDTLANIAGVTPPAYSATLPPTGGTPPVIATTLPATNAVNLATGNTLRGFTVGDTTAIDIASGASFGTLAVGEVTLTGAGQALSLLNGTLSASFLSIASTSGSQGIFLSQVAGSLASPGGTSTSGSSQGIVISNSAGNFSFGNTSVSASTAGISITSSTGTKTFGTLAASASNGTAILLTSAGTVTAAAGNSGNVSATNGPAIKVGDVTLNNSSAGSLQFGAVSSTNSTTNGISIASGTAGGLSITSTSVSGSTETGILANNGTAALSFGNTTVNDTGNSNSDTAGAGVHLLNYLGAVSFGDLDISPDSGERALLAQTNTGALTVASGTISSTNNVAVEITGTDSSNRTPLSVVFDSVSASGAAKGISVQNASDNGNGFRVTGSGSTDASGGTFSSISNRAAEFINAADVSLSNVQMTNVGTANGADPTNPNSACGGISPGEGGNAGCSAGVHAASVTGLSLANIDMNGGGQEGINLNSVTNFTLSNSNVLNMGDQVREDGLRALNLL
ncbi:MAG TPA: Ig-like domain-containing protein, partial [Pyrinomonadaceae bacterium]|nr:Ig-like domain-containing protein [Pyrinomonadaceae bacterium]